MSPAESPNGMRAPPTSKRTARLRIRIRGAVQGVGFRPFVYRVAARHALSGFVLNDGEGVLLEVEGLALHAFVAGLEDEAPPLARIDDVDVSVIVPARGRQFEIRESVAGAAQTRVIPDAGTCEACLDDLFDPASRFYLYPFVTCTHCGPRFTITRRLPYDRAETSMAAFSLCEACAQDYGNVASRRFHAKAIACPHCGPRLSHPIETIAAAVRAGKIIALKGIGGFHLICDARNETTVAELRRRKGREGKPFAIMIANEASVDLTAAPATAERALLTRSERPIVVMRRREGLPPSVAPGTRAHRHHASLRPAHHLLFRALAGRPGDTRWQPWPVALVATSANPLGEPLVIDDDDAHRRLADIADLIVTHDRAIVTRADDSVMAVIDGAPAYLRRPRGFGVAPEAIACDLHPDFPSTRVAEASGFPVYPAQHHAAHIAAVVAEHRVPGPVLGLALDGHGHGGDGVAWGGELIRLDGRHWQRLGHLTPLALPGSDRAARDPWRMGVAALVALGQKGEAARYFPDAPLACPLAETLARSPTAPTTTSMGRLFDAAAALLGLRMRQSYEGQAAMELEALVRTPRVLPSGYRLDDDVLDFRPLLGALLQLRCDPRAGAELFHGTLIDGLADWTAMAARRLELTLVGLGGGCFMNRVLAEGLAKALRERALVPLLPRAVPANDGGLSLGQASLARGILVKQVAGTDGKDHACVSPFPCA